ncbi:MAG: hypothetical protein WBD57_05645 [Candidatus Cybelea sp.]
MHGHARVVSSLVRAGGRNYVVDEMYTPSESNLDGIAPGPKGDVWFTGDTLVGKSSILSDISEYPISDFGNVTSIVEGPDKNLWVTLYPGAIGKLSADGRLTAFPLSRKLGGSQSSPFSIANGPDKSLWFVVDASSSYVVRISLAGAMRAYRMAPGAKLAALTVANDGKLWFTDAGTNKIGRMTAGGAVTEFPVPTLDAGLTGICQGPDGQMWFLEENANKAGSISSAGSVHEYDIPTAASGPLAIVAGPDKALWFTEAAAGKIGRLTTSGRFAELTLTSSYPRPADITVGSDQNVWFTESESYGIMGRVDLHEVKGSDPTYSEISLSLGKKSHPELGVRAKLPLSITAYNFGHHVIDGAYPNPIHLTTSDRERAGLSEKTVTASSSKVSVLFSGHYTDATIGASADGGGRIDPATVLPSAPREQKLPSPGYGLGAGPSGTIWVCLSSGKIAVYSMHAPLKVYRATTGFKEEGCSMIEGPDGNMWFTDYSNDRIGMITPEGHVTFFDAGYDAAPYSMTLGADGAFWFTEGFAAKIGRLTVSGQLSSFKAASTPYDIVTGPDGNLWYNAENGGIYKMTTAGKTTRVRSVYREGGLWAAAANIWFYDALNRLVEEMSTTGKILAKYAAPDCLPFALTGGPENSIWYVDAANDCVARLTLSGKFYVVPTYSQKNNPLLTTGIAVGPGDDLWFTATGTRGLGWIDPRTI